MEHGRIFLLSPAHTGGRRAKLLLRQEAGFELAQRFQRVGAPLGEIFSFVSGLYFRGKLAYSTRFGDPPPGLLKSLIITADRGLLDPQTLITPDDFRRMSDSPVDAANSIYREPLVRDLAALASSGCEIVLLGSIATGKYVGPLTEILGQRVLVPRDFPGLGDMSRGSLLLRSAQGGVELPYVTLCQLPRPKR